MGVWVLAWGLWGCGGTSPARTAGPSIADVPLESLLDTPVVPPDLCAGLVAADSFDFPVGPPDAKGYYDAQPFGKNRHLGSDWNAVTGGDTDYGHPVHAIADGRVTTVVDHGGGWGLVVRVAHRTATGCVESLYAHLETSLVEPDQRVERGEKVGTIGDAWGVYTAHLHFEIRSQAGEPLGGGYGTPRSHVDPTHFIRER